MIMWDAAIIDRVPVGGDLVCYQPCVPKCVLLQVRPTAAELGAVIAYWLHMVVRCRDYKHHSTTMLHNGCDLR